METTTNVQAPRKRSKKTLLIVGAAVIVVLGGLGTAFAKFDLFKSAKVIYLQSEATSMAKFSSDVSQMYSEYEAYMKPYLEKPVHSTTEISDITIDADIPDPETGKALDLIKNAKFVINSNVDEQKRQQSGNIELHLKSKKLATLEYFLNDSLLGFRLPEFYSKYGYLDLKDRDSIKQQFGEELPKRFLTYSDLYQAVQVKEDEVKSILTPYALLYADSLKESQISINKDVAFNEEGYQTNVREVTISFTPEEASSLLTQIAEKAQKDEKLFELIYSRYNNVTTLLNDSGYELDDVLSREEFKKSFDKTFTDMIEEVKLDEKQSDETLKMVVQIDADHQILSRKVLVANATDKSETVFWKSISYKNGADTYNLYNLMNPVEPDTSEMMLSYKAKEEKGKTNGTVGFLIKENDDTVVDMKTTFDTTKDDKKEDGTYDFSIAVQDEELMQNVTLSGKITSSLTKTDTGREAITDLKLNFDQSVPDLPRGISMKLKATEEFGKSLEMPQMNESNGINLAKMNDMQMMEIQQEVEGSLQKFMQENMELVQEFMMP